MSGRVTAVVAVARNGVIGRDNALPWPRLAGDLPRFRRLTTGSVMIMGRRTYDSIGGPLPDRETVVITRDAQWRAPGHPEVQVASGWGQALATARASGRPVVVAGGGEIYRLAWDDLTDLELTEVKAAPEGDATFPPLGPDWVETAREDTPTHAWVRYRRA